MKKIGVSIALLILIFSMLLVLADDADSGATDTISSADTNIEINQSKIDLGFKCLEEKAGPSCSSLSVQETALTILATPENITDNCVTTLKNKKNSNNCWGSGSGSACAIRDTALAILALNHAGENTDEAQSWLLNRTKVAKDLIWYIEQDSDEATECAISYSGNTYRISVGENKKISTSAGPCLSLAQSSFYLQVDPSCYDKEFGVTCDKNFISTLLYRQSGSGQTWYILSNTPSAASSGSITLKINAKCFSTSSQCDYEGSAWATLALLDSGRDVGDFMPYVIALADSNKKYLPNAFIYAITQETPYGNQLIQEQRVGNEWEAESTAYNRFYDTGLALVALSDSSAQQVISAKQKLLSTLSQEPSGCWKNSNNEIVRDTAIILWALAGRSHSSNPSVTYCEQAGFFCIPSVDCPETDKLSNYFCSSSTAGECCRTENLKSCSERSGQECGEDEQCAGLSVKSSDTDDCCLADCEPYIEPVNSECEEMGYYCKPSCSSSQEPVDAYSCDSGDICCKPSSTPEPSSWWIWLIIILIIIVIGVVIFLMRNRLRIMFFKSKSKFRESPTSTSPFPPRPGFPPIRRMPMPVRRMPPQPQAEDKRLDETFKKLREMSK